MNGHILYPEHILRAGVFVHCSIRDSCHSLCGQERICAGGVADQSQPRTPLHNQCIGIRQEGEAVGMRQPTSQNVDANVMLFRRIETIGSRSHVDRPDAKLFGRVRRLRKNGMDDDSEGQPRCATEERAPRDSNQTRVRAER